MGDRQGDPGPLHLARVVTWLPVLSRVSCLNVLNVTYHMAGGILFSPIRFSVIRFSGIGFSGIRFSGIRFSLIRFTKIHTI